MYRRYKLSIHCSELLVCMRFVLQENDHFIFLTGIAWILFKYQPIHVRAMMAIITVMFHGCQGVSNHRQPDCLYNSLFRLTKNTPTHHLFLLGESTRKQWIPLEMDHVEIGSMPWSHHDNDCCEDSISYGKYMLLIFCLFSLFCWFKNRLVFRIWYKQHRFGMILHSGISVWPLDASLFMRHLSRWGGTSNVVDGI